MLIGEYIFLFNLILRVLLTCIYLLGLLSFRKFTSSIIIYKIYDFKAQKFNSTLYVGRLIAKGYLIFILWAHKLSDYGMVIFKEEDMLVEIELVNGDAIGEINFFYHINNIKNYKKD